MMICFLLLFLSFSSVEPYFFYKEYRPVECGEVFSEKDGVLLPEKKNCDLKVEVPEGETFTFTLIDEDSAQMNCKKIIIVDESTQTKYSICPSMSFSGSSKYYSIRIKGLLRPAKAHIDFFQTAYKCGQIVPRERGEHPLTFVNDGADSSGCYLIIPTSNTLRIQRNTAVAPDNECETQVEITQGRHIAQMLKSTGRMCLGQSPLETRIYCGVAIIYFDGPLGTSFNVSAVPSKSPSPFLDSLLECDEF